MPTPVWANKVRDYHRGRVGAALHDLPAPPSGKQRYWNGPTNKYGNAVSKGVTANDAARITEARNRGMSPDEFDKQIHDEQEAEAITKEARKSAFTESMIIAARKAAGLDKPQETTLFGSSGGGGGIAAGPAPGGGDFTPEERKIAAGLGQSPAYVRSMRQRAQGEAAPKTANGEIDKSRIEVGRPVDLKTGNYSTPHTPAPAASPQGGPAPAVAPMIPPPALVAPQIPGAIGGDVNGGVGVQTTQPVTGQVPGAPGRSVTEGGQTMTWMDYLKKNGSGSALVASAGQADKGAAAAGGVVPMNESSKPLPVAPPSTAAIPAPGTPAFENLKRIASKNAAITPANDVPIDTRKRDDLGFAEGSPEQQRYNEAAPKIAAINAGYAAERAKFATNPADIATMNANVGTATGALDAANKTGADVLKAGGKEKYIADVSTYAGGTATGGAMVAGAPGAAAGLLLGGSAGIVKNQMDFDKARAADVDASNKKTAAVGSALDSVRRVVDAPSVPVSLQKSRASFNVENIDNPKAPAVIDSGAEKLKRKVEP